MDSRTGETESLGMRRQLEIYSGALEGRKPELPLAVEELEARAREALRPEAFDYVAGGAGGERTMRANLAAFDRYPLLPRMLRADAARRDLSTQLFGHTLRAPLLLAPVGVQGIVHPEGELEVGRAAAALRLPFVLSTLSSQPMEAVAAAMGDAPRWFQLYWSRDMAINASLVGRAEASGYSAVVVTLDTTLLGWRERDLQRAYLPFLAGDGLANYFADPAFRAKLAAPPEADPATAIRTFLGLFSNPSLAWSDLPRLRAHTRLPILVKGVQHRDDAARALDAGVDGIIVSNHGGRQVDGAVGALDALPAVAASVEGRVPVLFDSGIRRGADVVKALALGAQAVLVGRPYVWGLALGGEAGVRNVLVNLLADLDITLGLCGCGSLAAVKPDLIART